MTTERLIFAAGTIGVGFIMESQLKGWTARLGIIALAVSVMLLGPSIIGKDWFYDGYIAGLIFGDLYGSAVTRAESRTN